jgi:hypothetical protein
VVDVLLSVQERFDQASLETARLTQAMTIAGFDYFAQGVTRVSRAMPRAANPGRGVVARLATHQAGLLDRQYALLDNLFRLHREFAQRLFDVLGARELKDTMSKITPPPGNVISIQTARKLR